MTVHANQIPTIICGCCIKPIILSANEQLCKIIEILPRFHLLEIDCI